MNNAQLQALQMNFLQMLFVFGVHCRDPRHQDGDLQNGASAV
ncbi:MAG: hypothetical protein ACK4NU_04060 [Brevundimonas sp.]